MHPAQTLFMAYAVACLSCLAPVALAVVKIPPPTQCDHALTNASAQAAKRASLRHLSPLVQGLRRDLDTLSQIGLRRRSIEFWLKQVRIESKGALDEARTELRNLRALALRESEDLAAVLPLVKKWNRTVGSLPQLLSEHPRLQVIEARRQALAGELPHRLARLKIAELGVQLHDWEFKIEHVLDYTWETFIRQIDKWLASPSLSLHDYLSAFCDYLLIANVYEPWAGSFAHDFLNPLLPRNFRQGFLPVRLFASPTWRETRRVFPDSLYLPTTQNLPLKEFNDRFTAGLYPVGILHAGKILRVDGTRLLGALDVALHDVFHPPFLRRHNQIQGGHLTASQHHEAIRAQRDFRQQVEIAAPSQRAGFAERMEVLYWHILRDLAWGMLDFGTPRTWQVESVLDATMKELQEDGNFPLLLSSDRTFKDRDDLIHHLTLFPEFYRLSSRR